MANLRNSSLLSGFAISICAFCYSALSGTIAGAFIFSFGLITIVLYGWKLYTGSAGFIKNTVEFRDLVLILFYNCIGCMSAAILLSTFGNVFVTDFIGNAINLRSITSYSDIIPVFTRGIFCGFIMTTAVKFARLGVERGFQYFLPLLLGVPLFLMSGFYHSIVDIFYLCYGVFNDIITTNNELFAAILGWVTVAVGNFIGCNLTRIVTLNLNA